MASEQQLFHLDHRLLGISPRAVTLFVPEMLRAAKAMKADLAVLRPYIAGADVRSTGTVVIGTVKSDLHDIGKNLVGMMLEGAGFRIIDLGVDVSAESFLDAAHDNAADIVAMSALLTTTMPAMKATVAGARRSTRPSPTRSGPTASPTMRPGRWGWCGVW